LHDLAVNTGTAEKMEKTKVNDPQIFQVMPAVNYKESEVDLYGFFSSIFGQWKLILTITSLGMLFVGLIVLLLPKEYEVSAELTQPSLAQIQTLNTRGYKNDFTPVDLFVQFYNQLRSPQQLRHYLKDSGWFEKLYPSDTAEKQDVLFAEFNDGFKVTVVETINEKWMEEHPMPSLINISMLHSNETLISKFLRDYISHTNQFIISTIIADGKRLRELEIEKIENQIRVLRANAKLKKELLLEKLQDALVLAEKLGIKKPTTIERISSASKNARTTEKVKRGEYSFLMGTTYLGSKIDALKQRKKAGRPGKEVSDQMNLREPKGNDPFIDGLPDLFKRMVELQLLTFDFNSSQVFRMHKDVIEDNEIAKPNWKLILLSGFVVSGITGLFVALIRNKRDSRLVQSD
jgi:LPS O-antigen subunit length determinant protein (WzzB/FepE family)